jgi:adenosylmethionine-8-amino-7-oxononanoate aminotransferase
MNKEKISFLYENLPEGYSRIIVGRLLSLKDYSNTHAEGLRNELGHLDQDRVFNYIKALIELKLSNDIQTLIIENIFISSGGMFETKIIEYLSQGK